MSAAAIDRTGTTPTRRTTPTPYWAFFPTDNGAFWHVVVRSQEAFQTQEASPQHGEQKGDKIVLQYCCYEPILEAVSNQKAPNILILR